MIAKLEMPSFEASMEAEQTRQREKRQAIISGSFSMGTAVSPDLFLKSPKFGVRGQNVPKMEVVIMDLIYPPPNAPMQSLGRISPSVILMDVGGPFSFSDSTRLFAVTSSASVSPTLEGRIKSLAALPFDWDGEGAKPVKPRILAHAVETLKRLSQQSRDFREPFIVPTYNGFLQMEWHHQNRSLELEAAEDGWSAVGSLVGATGERQYFTAELEPGNFPQVEKLYDWLSGYDLWPLL